MSRDRSGFTSSSLTPAASAPDNLNIQTAGPRGPALLQDVWLIEKLAIRRFDPADQVEGSIATVAAD
jgi:catalase